MPPPAVSLPSVSPTAFHIRNQRGSLRPSCGVALLACLFVENIPALVDVLVSLLAPSPASLGPLPRPAAATEVSPEQSPGCDGGAPRGREPTASTFASSSVDCGSAPSSSLPMQQVQGCALSGGGGFSGSGGKGDTGSGSPIAYLATTLRNEATFERWERHAQAHGLILEDYTAHLPSSGGGSSGGVGGVQQGGGGCIGSSSSSSGADPCAAAIRFLHRSSEEGGGCRIVLTRITHCQTSKWDTARDTGI